MPALSINRESAVYAPKYIHGTAPKQAPKVPLYLCPEQLLKMRPEEGPLSSLSEKPSCQRQIEDQKAATCDSSDVS